MADESLRRPEVLRVVERRIGAPPPDGSRGCGTYACAGELVTEVFVRNALSVGTFRPPCETNNTFIAGVDVGEGVHVFTFDQPFGDEGTACDQGIDGVSGDRKPPVHFDLEDNPRTFE